MSNTPANRDNPINANDMRMAEGYGALANRVVGGKPGEITLQPVEEATEEEWERLQALFPNGYQPVTAATPLNEQTIQRERMRWSMWNARGEAIMSQFRMNRSPQEHLSAMSLVLQLELGLMLRFNEAFPAFGEVWDAERRRREINLRLARMRWLERQDLQPAHFLRGVWMWIKVAKPLSGEELFAELVCLADAENRGAEIGVGHVHLMRAGDVGEMPGWFLRAGGFTP